MKRVWMNETEVSKAFSDKVAEQFSKGLTLFPQTMAGHQGEISKVDFTDGKGTIYRVVLYSKDIKFGDKWYDTREAVVLEVRKYSAEEEHINTNEFSNFNTLWTEHGEKVEKTIYYRFTHGNNRYTYSYTTDLEYVQDMEDARKAKREWGHYKHHEEICREVSAIKPSKKLVDFIRKNGGWGYGNTKLEMIDWVEKIQGGYRVHFTRESNKNAVGFCAR